MRILDKSEYYILTISIVLLMIVLLGYSKSTNLLYLSLPLAFFVFWKSKTPVDILIPLAITVTWGAELWAVANSRLYTILKLSLLVLFFFKASRTYNKIFQKGFLLILSLFICYNIINETLNFANGPDWMFYVNLSICYMVIFIVARNSTLEDYEKLSFALGVGVFFSAIISLLSPFIPSLAVVVLEMIQTDNSFDGAVIEARFSSLAYDPNQFGMYVDCAMAANIFVVIQRKFKKSIPHIVLLLSLFAVGVMTLSKAYFLVTSILMGYTYIQIIKSNNISSNSKAFINVAIVIILCGFTYYMGDYFDAVISRFSEGSKEGDLTTGRSDILVMYSNYLLDNPDILLFGRSLLGKLANHSTPHNFAMFCLFFFGIIGTTFFIFLIKYILNHCTSYRSHFYDYIQDRKLHYMPLLIYLLFSFTIDPFALYDAKMMILAVAFTAWMPLKQK